MEWKPGSQKHFKKEGVLQFATALIKNVKVGPSPQWLVKKLEAMGSRSINNVVDATNLILWELGHPVHAYDADRLKNSVGARFAESGERLQLLDDSIIELTNHDLVIVDQVLNDVSQSGTRPIGLAGVMGGADTQVTDQTTHLLLECAQFTPHFVRKSKQYHQKLTEAAYRFERGIDGESVRFDLERLADLVLKVAGGQLVEKTYVDLRDQAAGTQKWIPMSTEWLNRFLGTSLEAPLIKKILQNLDCEVIENSKNPSMISWKVNPPSYRLDLNLPEDLAEEIARTVGYDVIPSTVPALSSQPSSLSNLLEALSVLWADQVKDAFVQNGFNEVLNYAFTNQDQLHKLGFHSPVIRLMNPLSQDHEVLVPSLIPGLLKNAHDNFRKHFGSEACQLKLFEVRPVFSKKAEATLSESETGISESLKIAFLLSGSRIQQGLKQDLVEYDFFDLKAVIEKLFDEIEVRGVRIIPLQQSRSQLEVKGCFHPGQACEVLVGNQSAGYFGALHPNLAKQFKFKQKIFICELDGAVLRQLSRKAQQARKFKEWPEFPGMERDFSLIVKSDVSSEQLIKTVLKAGQPLAKKAKIFDIYRGSSIPQGMTSVAFKVIFLDESRSLQESETEAASQQILQALQKEFDAQLRM
jgi:phenylalanyl-tRNA synthetase beta chain